ncbi:MAG: PD-(D/E)XK nuclease family protein [Bacteroidetes bacterium]|nr:PD-(D/E)XK nuclease family protein [Bacteroidota bacterium]
MSANKPFIQLLAEHIAVTYADRLRDIILLFPNKRAGLFFKKALSQSLSKASWLPQISTIEQAFADWSPWELADSLSVQFELLEMKAAQLTADDFSLAEYAGLAAQMAEDYNEIDQQMADASAVFGYLKEAKALEIWHPDGTALSDSEKRFLSFYRLLEKDYHALRNRLTEKGMAYSGMVARYLADLEDGELINRTADKLIIFAGFNALTKAEEKIVVKLFQAEKALLFWDIDTYYFKANAFGLHEAGNFIRKFSDRFPNAVRNFISDDLINSSKQIIVHPIPGNATQAKAMGHELMHSEADNNTAIVLADENLLIPVLNAIPDSVGHFNVTLGFPFNKTAVFQYLSTYINVHLKQRKVQLNTRYHLKPLLQLSSHELNTYLLDDESMQQLMRWKQQLLNNSQRFAEAEEIKKSFDKNSRLAVLFEALLKPVTDDISAQLGEIISFINQLSDWVLESKKPEKHTIVNQFIASKKLLIKIQQLTKSNAAILNFEDFSSLFNKLALSLKVPFSGEPLQGLQIMGLLETRNLDFKNIHILSVNEGILPHEKSYQSLIPPDIRKAFDLSNHFDRQAVYAYHFFRLLQKAETIHLYYNNEPGSFGSGEQSRFIQQIRFELLKLNPKISLRNQLFELPPPSNKQDNAITIAKSIPVMELLKKKGETGLSPSSLANYIICPLRFYLGNVVGLQVQAKYSDAIQYNDLGTAVHNTLETLYQEFVDKKITPTAIDKMTESSENVLNKHLLEIYPAGLADFGNSLLMKEVARQFVQNFLSYEKKNLVSNEITIKGLEKKLEVFIESKGQKIKIKGTIDRIDQQNDKIRLIDYKTGSVHETDLSLKAWDELLKPAKSKALQLAIYQLLILKSDLTFSGKEMECGIISLQKPGKGMLNLNLPDPEESASLADSIIQQLNIVIGEIYDPETPVVQTTETKYCSYCDFAGICNR